MDNSRRERLTEQDPAFELAQKKQELRCAVGNVDFLRPLRRHPYLTVGTAAAVGITAGSGAVVESLHVGVKAKLQKRLITFALAQAIRFVRNRHSKAEPANATTK